jgi:NAD(P)-dependent dehydrogenase (short-subunit alcohol dehydrogenase family)
MATSPYMALLLMQACLPHMKTAGGRIVNLVSAIGLQGTAGFLPYAMAKEAMRTITRVAAREWGRHGITVNSICPAADSEAAREAVSSGALDRFMKGTGAVRPIPRLGSAAEDVAPLVTHLAGPHGSYLTGYTYLVNGGSCMSAAR